MPPSRLSANIWKFYVFSVLQGITWGLVIPILVLFYVDRGISLETFMILMAVMNFTIFAMEIPGGIIADRFSRKWSIFSGRLALTVSWALMLLTTDSLLLGLSFALFGLGESLISGADSALLYDSLMADGREEDFQDTFGNTVSIRLGSMVVGTILCGFVVGRMGLAEPFIQTAMNDRLTSDKRAYCLSMAKMGMNFMGVFLGPMFGWLADTYSLATSLSVYQWIFGPMLVIGLLWAFFGLRRSPAPA